MKILLVNAPFVTYRGKFKNVDALTFCSRVAGKMRKWLGGHIWPRGLKELADMEHFRWGIRAGSRWPWSVPYPPGCLPFPFIMAYAAGLLKNNGYETDIIDCVTSRIYSYGKFLRLARKARADIVIVECSTPTIGIDLWMVRKISRFADVALAGPHLTDEITPELQKAHPHIKYFLKGEYILSSLEMAKTRREGIYEGEVVRDLDAIPFPWRGYPDAEKCFEPTMPTEQPQLQIYASKGCPFKCKFCVWPQVMYKGQVSFRKPEAVAREIRENVAKYGYKSVFFDDDTFNIGTPRISELCDRLKEIGLPWTMMGRLDCSTDWLYDKMVDCGCVGFRFGVESFNLDVLNRINKGLERVDFVKTLEYLSGKYPQVWIHLTMMKNMPGQTDEIHQNDLDILKKLGFSSGNVYRSYQLATCAPFPGTQLFWEMVEKHGDEKMKRWDQYDGGKDTIMTEIGSAP